MATLTNEVQALIVQGLATYMTPTEVADMVSKEFGLKIDRVQVAKYDPTKVSGKNLSKKWKDRFHEQRKQFNEDIANIPIANLAVRLRRLEENYTKTKSPIIQLKVLEQAAKEVGEVFTNKAKIDNTSSDGSMTTKPTIIELVAQPFPHETAD